jgi:hypothetical protein
VRGIIHLLMVYALTELMLGKGRSEPLISFL